MPHPFAMTATCLSWWCATDATPSRLTAEQGRYSAVAGKTTCAASRCARGGELQRLRAAAGTAALQFCLWSLGLFRGRLPQAWPLNLLLWLREPSSLAWVGYYPRILLRFRAFDGRHREPGIVLLVLTRVAKTHGVLARGLFGAA